MFAKDDQTYLSVVEEGTVLKPAARYGSRARRSKAEQTLSLESLQSALGAKSSHASSDFSEAVIESEATPLSLFTQREHRNIYKVIAPKIERPEYDDTGALIKKGDDTDLKGQEIPFMRDLWDTIDWWDRYVGMWEGTIKPDEYALTHTKNTYQLQKIKHLQIDLRRRQYQLRDTYCPVVELAGASGKPKTTINYSEDSGIWMEKKEWMKRYKNYKPYDIKQAPPVIPKRTTRKKIEDEAAQTAPAISNEGFFKLPPQEAIKNAPYNPTSNKYMWVVSHNTIDYENPHHIKNLLALYTKLLERAYPNPDSELRMICWDIEKLIEDSNLDDLDSFLLRCFVARYNTVQVQKVLERENIFLSDGQVFSGYKRVFKTLAETAKRNRIWAQAELGEIPYYVCETCGRKLPLDPMYFYKTNSKLGYRRTCKECIKKQKEMM